jgi:uncharacterized protein YbjT (DUF2867 family)
MPISPQRKKTVMKVLVLGANGQIARFAIDLFLEHTGAQLTLYLRRAKRLRNPDPRRVRVIDGDVLDRKKLDEAMKGQDVVYANLAGDLEAQARSIIEAMRHSGLKRLIFITSMGIYDEIPGEHHGSVLDPYRNAAKVIEASDLDYTIIRPAWLNNGSEIAYGTTPKDEPFKNAGEMVSRKSVADLVVKLATTPGLGVRQSLGVHKE